MLYRFKYNCSCLIGKKYLLKTIYILADVSDYNTSFKFIYFFLFFSSHLGSLGGRMVFLLFPSLREETANPDPKNQINLCRISGRVSENRRLSVYSG